MFLITKHYELRIGYFHFFIVPVHVFLLNVIRLISIFVLSH
jgi:hypothetical protein